MKDCRIVEELMKEISANQSNYRGDQSLNFGWLQQLWFLAPIEKRSFRRSHINIWSRLDESNLESRVRLSLEAHLSFCPFCLRQVLFWPSPALLQSERHRAKSGQLVPAVLHSTNKLSKEVWPTSAPFSGKLEVEDSLKLEVSLQPPRSKSSNWKVKRSKSSIYRSTSSQREGKIKSQPQKVDSNLQTIISFSFAIQI